MCRAGHDLEAPARVGASTVARRVGVAHDRRLRQAARLRRVAGRGRLFRCRQDDPEAGPLGPAVDIDGLESGQLSYLVTFGHGRVAAEMHELVFTLLQIAAALHVAAILFYLLVRRRNLISPMVTGIEPAPDASQCALVYAPLSRLVLAAGVAAALAWWAANGFAL